ncbi:uncharacterized protein LOC144439640 [Glandiceps talaboti]
MMDKAMDESIGTITPAMISDVAKGCENLNIPMAILLVIIQILQKWFVIYGKKHLIETDLDVIVDRIARLIALEDETPHKFDIRSGRSTERNFHMCGQKNTVQTDVEFHIHTSDNYDFTSGYRLLAVTENKTTEQRIDHWFPQMMCQQVTAAKESCFSTPDHYVVYNVSLCGRDEVFLSRSHVHKGLIEREGLCVHDNPPTQPSYLFYCTESEKITLSFNMLPVLNVYIAMKALLLLHRKVNRSNEPAKQPLY